MGSCTSCTAAFVVLHCWRPRSIAWGDYRKEKGGLASERRNTHTAVRPSQPAHSSPAWRLRINEGVTNSDSCSLQRLCAPQRGRYCRASMARLLAQTDDKNPSRMEKGTLERRPGPQRTPRSEASLKSGEANVLPSTAHFARGLSDWDQGIARPRHVTIPTWQDSRIKILK